MDELLGLYPAFTVTGVLLALVIGGVISYLVMYKRTILVKDDFSIDFKQLTSILHGIPSKPFYMSNETYDIFEEREKAIPPIIDQVQKAVDQYVKDQKKYPMLPYDPLRRVNYYLEHYLDTMLEVELYITDYDGLISHHKPKKKHAGD